MNNVPAAAIALIYSVNGLHMLADPAAWYLRLPGVSASGPMNPHFIRDIGFIYLLSGLAFAIALRRPRNFVLWASLGTAWPALHAVFHLLEWFAHGLPAVPIVAAEVLGILLPVVIGLALIIAAYRHPASLPA